MTKARRWWFVALAVAGCHDEVSDSLADASADTAILADAPDAQANSSDAALVCTETSPMPCPPLTYATWRMPSPPGVASPESASYVLTQDEAAESVSGLVWQRAFTPKKTWADAVSYCADLNLGGSQQWRLPSRIELVSLIDFTRLPSIDQEAFPETAIDYFWSASPAPNKIGDFFSVYFGAGLTDFGVATSPSAHVRCVRGGGPGLLPRFELSDQTATDRNTHLVWQRRHLDQPLAWEAARDYCSGLGNAWRLPSTKELQTIVDETRANPTADPAIFFNTPSASFWTSTPVNRSGLMNTVFVDMRDGTTEEAGTTENYWVRCVR